MELVLALGAAGGYQVLSQLLGSGVTRGSIEFQRVHQRRSSSYSALAFATSTLNSSAWAVARTASAFAILEAGGRLYPNFKETMAVGKLESKLKWQPDNSLLRQIMQVLLPVGQIGADGLSRAGDGFLYATAPVLVNWVFMWTMYKAKSVHLAWIRSRAHANLVRRSMLADLGERQRLHEAHARANSQAVKHDTEEWQQVHLRSALVGMVSMLASYVMCGSLGLFERASKAPARSMQVAHMAIVQSVIAIAWSEISRTSMNGIL